MNLVGKIFTVLILLMSLIFMALAVTVYATHKNWREVVLNPTATSEKELGLKFQLENARTRANELKDQQAKLEGELAAEKAARTQALAKLRTENEGLQRERDQLAKEQAKLVQAQREAVAAMQATQETLASLRKEVDGLRLEVRAAQKDRDEHFKEVVRLTDELHQSVNELKRLKERNVTLTADLTKAREVLRLHDLDENKDYSGKPPRVDGVVLATTGSDLVEISLGADQGLLKGHRLEVYRRDGTASKYLGRIVVVQTSPDKAVCKIDPNYRQGPIQNGDRVASKLD